MLLGQSFITKKEIVEKNRCNIWEISSLFWKRTGNKLHCQKILILVFTSHLKPFNGSSLDFSEKKTFLFQK